MASERWILDQMGMIAQADGKVIGDALDLKACESMIAAANRAEGEGWVSVKERLPEEGIAVIAWDGSRQDLCDYDQGRFWMKQFDAWVYVEATHWRPLPAPPKEGA